MYVEKGVAALVTVAVLVVIVLLGWIGGELHYRSCLASVDVRYPVAYNPGKPNSAEQLGIGQQPYFAFYPGKAERSQAISDCSRLPF